MGKLRTAGAFRRAGLDTIAIDSNAINKERRVDQASGPGQRQRWRSLGSPAFCPVLDRSQTCVGKYAPDRFVIGLSSTMSQPRRLRRVSKRGKAGQLPKTRKLAAHSANQLKTAKMFTGLVGGFPHRDRTICFLRRLPQIECLGTVVDIKRDEGGCTLIIGDSGDILGDCHVGDSIAVNGACLTVVEFDRGEKGGWFTVWLANETLDKTVLGEQRRSTPDYLFETNHRTGDRVVGEHVNLERAMAAHARFGGHFVQAHVDTTVTLVDKVPDGDSIRLTFELADETMLPYMVPKGYVTLDGASLTLTFVNDDQRRFGVMLITHTQEKITLGKKKVGSRVNLEVDMLGKYVQKSTAAALRSRK